MTAEQRDELGWIAFRYVAGEMTAEEAAALERRLADDQDAREAVSRAVAFSLRVAGAAPVRSDRQPASLVHADGQTRSLWNRGATSLRGRAIRAAGWMAAGAAAATLVFWLARAGGAVPAEMAPGSPNKSNVARVRPTEPAADAVAWVELRASGDWATEFEGWLVEPRSHPAGSPTVLENAPTLPPWLLAVTARPDKGDRP